ncbi:MAG TPA: hypothetical protein DCP28_12380 [Cytophagales bacterium]|nr:hypothetical protein [Cytophagales bacterium]
MEEAPKTEGKGKKFRPLRILFWVVLSLLTLAATTLVLVRVPAVQTRLTQYFADIISERMGFPTTVEEVSIEWFDTIGLKKIQVKDSLGVALFDLAQLDLTFSRESLRNPRDIVLGEATLHRPVMHSVRQIGQYPNITQWVTQINRLTGKQDPSQPKPPFRLTIESITLIDGEFGQRDYNKDSVEGFNHNHFYLTQVSGTLSDFEIHTDTVMMQVTDLYAVDSATGLTVRDSRTHFTFAQTYMHFANTEVNVGQSVIKDSLRFTYPNPQVFGYWVDSVEMTLWLNNSKIHAQDLAYFAPALRPYNDIYTVSGLFQGTVSRFDLNDFVLSFGSNSVFNGNLSMIGLPNIEETFISLDLSGMQVQAPDVRQYVPEMAYPKVASFRRIRGGGQFFGFVNDFVSSGSFRTGLGSFKTDLNLKLEGEANSTYSGYLALQDVDLGQVLETNVLGLVAMEANLEGTGLNLSTANLHLNATFERLDLLDYSYVNIATDADLAAELFEGSFSIEDPNLQFALDGTIDISEGSPRVKANGLLDTLFFQPLGWIDEESFLRTEFAINIEGLALDSITGYGHFTDTYMEYQGRSHLMDSLTLFSRQFDGERSLQVITERFEVEATGPFHLSPVITDTRRLLYEYELNFSNNEDSILHYYETAATESPEPYYLDYQLNALDLNPLIQLFFPEVFIAPGTQLEGNLRGGPTYILSMLSTPDTLVVGDYHFGKGLVDISTSKVFNEPDVLASVILEAETFSLPGVSTTSDVFFESVWFNQNIDFRVGISQVSSGSLAELEGQVHLLPDEIEVEFIQSDLAVLDKSWDMADGGFITIGQRTVNVHQITFMQGNQRVALEGILSDSLSDVLTVEIDSFNLENLNPLLAEELTGSLNGTANISNPFKNLLIETKLNVDNLYLSGFLIGDIEAESKFDTDTRRLDVVSELFRDELRTIYLYGAYFPEDDHRLDMVASFTEADLSTVEPFFDETFSEIRGKASGTFRIRGTTDLPLLKGDGNVTGGHLRINYLNTRYDFNGQIAFTENEIGFRNLEVDDENQNMAFLDGGIFHDGFKDFVLSLHGEFTNFQVMKTTALDNDYFYGTAVATGSVDFLGPIDNLDISGEAITERGTRLYIPIDYSTTAEQAEFIKFVNLADTTQKEQVGLEAEGTVDLSDINLDFDVDVTKDAYVELIFDLKAGDIIRGRGTGEINMEIDQEGTFNMFGDLAIDEGGYNFTLYNLINKEFDIIPGSTISWTGDPYEAQMDISATYRQLTSLKPVLMGYSTADTSIVNQSQEANRRYPAEALLYMKGDLLSPDINFGVDVTDYPNSVNTTVNGTSYNIDIQSSISAFKEALRTDEQEMKRQVFSLIILKRFSEPQAFDTGSGVAAVSTQAIGASVSELLSNQLSYWVTQVDENLEIDFDINSLSEEDLNTFQLRLSYSFLDGRLRVTRDGRILNDNADGGVGSDIVTLIGDWSVEFLLTPDGLFRIKMYSRNNLNNGNNPTLNSYFGQTTTTGVSLMHTQSFNNVNELFDFIRERRENNVEAQQAEDSVRNQSSKVDSQ